MSNRDNKIQGLLAYMAALYRFLKDPSQSIDLDAFCLDAVTLYGHNASLSERPSDRSFITRTHLPLYDLDEFMPLEHDAIGKLEQSWQGIYQGLVLKHAPKPRVLVQASGELKQGNLTKKRAGQKRSDKPDR